MLNKFCFEALDRTLNDIMKVNGSNDSDVRFGGKIVVFCGDFRQILPVVERGTRSSIVNSAIKS